MPNLSKEAGQFLALLEGEGWTFIGRTKKKHLRLRHPESGAVAVVSSTPSDHRSRLNTRSRLRRLAATSRPRTERIPS